MKRLLLALTFFWALQGLGHTSYKSTVKCPIDKEKFDVYITGSYTTSHTLKDFQKQGFIGDLYESSIVACPKCHYSGYVSDFDSSYTNEKIEAIRTILMPYEKEKPDDVMENEIAVQLYLYFKRPMKEIAWLYLMASYYVKQEPDRQEKRKELQLKCIEYTLLAIEAKEWDNKETYAVEYYLVGELYRRLGEFDKALTYYTLASESKPKPEWLDEILKEQREMALNQNDDNSI